MANRVTLAMLDLGAQPSVIDTSTLRSLGAGHLAKPIGVGGVGGVQLQYKEVHILVDADGCAILQEFQVNESTKATVFLGRDFLCRFQSTEFDRRNHKVKLRSK